MLSKDTTTNLKGFAILIVMLGHLVNINKSTLNYDFRYFAAFSVAIFLIVSGYGLSASFSSNGLKHFFSKRLSAVIIPYAIATIFVSFAYNILFNDPIRVLRIITLNNPNNAIDGTLWFIYFISIWYVLFFISYSAFKTKCLRVFSLFVFSIYIYHTKLTEPFPVLDFQFKLHAFSFAIGVVLYEYKERISWRWVAVIGVFVFGFSVRSLFTNFTMISYEVSCISFGLLIVALFYLTNFKNNILSYLGDLSYEMYLFEGVLLGVMYSENLIINAVMFIFFTTATAGLFKKITESVKCKSSYLVKWLIKV
ncbi:acyltransferase family protein [Escherichia coli]|uniref:acyltransferase family protein n=1 Tax=Escherichia coli TaxID=562 RepID=UPI001299DBD2|nr:acyltransferase family protein [Escherichia coli]MBN4737612.1 acyltransferase family protein [Escherichia coli]MBZ2215922.1 acyltransferase [Escherichia coli]MBZ2229262.1 acyltransferase [Escherichia coli]MBZ2276320.1 acyltransferase [Escherichia coli]MRG19469.1 acyltransferase family protein [Escherichia coli]